MNRILSSWAWVLAAVAVGGPVSVSGAEASRADAVLVEAANDHFSLLKCEVASLDVDTRAGVTQRVLVPYDGAVLEFDVGPFSARSEHYEVKYQQADGSYVVVEPGAVRTIRGTVANVPGARVAGGTSDDGMMAVVMMPDGRRIWIEPLVGRVAGAVAGDHVIYDAEDVVGQGGDCGTEVDREAAAIAGGGGPVPAGAGCDTLPCIAELGCDSDVEYYGRWGEGVEARINLVIGLINEQYEEEVGIRHEITTIIVRPDEPDPYSSTSSNSLLNQFRSHWLSNQGSVVRDVAKLFTGKEIQGSVIGEAFTIGGICTTSSYCYSQSDWSGLSCATDLAAHELGHLWGAFHCNCSGFTMNTPTNCGNQFASSSVVSIVNHRNSRNCLGNPAPSTTFPFSDSFEGPVLDPTRWVAEGATVDTVGSGEPSAVTSMRLNGVDKPSTGFMDTTTMDRVGVEYWWQRSGTLSATGSPEPGEDLVVEYQSASGFWSDVAVHPGAGADNEPYVRSCVLLGEDSSHEGFRVRLRLISAEGGDNFFVDDFAIVDGAEFLSIVEHPGVTSACLGGEGSFSVVATGEGPFGYQWFRDGLTIGGATEPSLLLTDVSESDFASYTVEVTGSCGSVLSDPAVLLEATPVTITQDPQSQEVSPGGFLSLIANATGGGVLFQWSFNGDAIDGATSSFFFVASVGCENQGCYSMTATNDCGSVESALAEVLVTGCGVLDCEAGDVIAPEIVHAAGLVGQTRPYSGYIDPRIESSDGAQLDRGVTALSLLFSEPVVAVGGGALTADSFEVRETGGGVAPSIVGVDNSAMPLVVLTLDRPITLREYTTVQAMVEDLSGNVIVDNGDEGADVDETDRVDVAFLPGDIDQNGSVTPFDLLTFRQLVNGGLVLDQGESEDFVDTNRDGALTPFDLLTYRQLVNGTTPATEVWSGESLNNPRP
jgi:metallopeptidase family M12-like protein/dockerin type I repeat protein